MILFQTGIWAVTLGFAMMVVAPRNLLAAGISIIGAGSIVLALGGVGLLLR